VSGQFPRGGDTTTCGTGCSDIDASQSGSGVAPMGDACKPAATLGTDQPSEANAAAVSQHVADRANADDDTVQQAARDVDQKQASYQLDLLTLVLQDLAQREKVPAEELESFTASDTRLRGHYDAAFPK
jgi:hypothetical protein